MTSQSNPVNTAGGNDVSGDVKDYVFYKSGLVDKPYRMKFTNTYEHYIGSDSADSVAPQVGILTNTSTAANNQKCFAVSHQLAPIPYYNLGAATHQREWSRHFGHAGRVRVLSLGYKIKDVMFMEQRLKNVAQTTTLENTFISKPRLMVFTDDEQKFDAFVGLNYNSINATALDARALFAQCTELVSGHPRVAPPMVPPFTELLNRGVDTWYMARSIPNSFQDGLMPQCSWYLPCYDMGSQNGNNGELTNPTPQYTEREIQDFTHPYECLHGKPLGENDKHEFTWHNPSPDWISATPSQFIWQGGSDVTNKWKTVGVGWPKHRGEAVVYSYRKTILDEVRDLPRFLGNFSAGWNVDGTDGRPPGEQNYNTMKESHSFRPPMHYLHIAPIYTPVGEMAITARILIEYHMEVEIDPAFTFNGCLRANNPFGNNDLVTFPPVAWYDPMSCSGNLSKTLPYF